MSNIQPVPGSTSRQRTRGWFASASHQWDSFSPSRMNWRDFTLLHIGGEWNEMSGRVEAELTILGLSLTVAYVYDDTFTRELMARRDTMLADMQSRTESE